MHENAVEINRNNGIILTFPVYDVECNDRRTMAIEVLLNFTFHVVNFNIFIIFYKNKFFID
jgi:hypothetical protein